MKYCLVLLLFPLSLLGADLVGLTWEGEESGCGSPDVISQAYTPLYGNVLLIDDDLVFHVEFINRGWSDKVFKHKIRLAGINFSDLSVEKKHKAWLIMKEWVKGNLIEFQFATTDYLDEHHIAPAILYFDNRCINFSILKCGYGSVEVQVPYEIDSWLSCLFEKARAGRI